MISSAKNSYVRVTYYPNQATQDKLKKLPKEILKEFARSILNDSSNLVPFRTGNMWKRTMQAGVKENSDGVYIESPVWYANYVWNMGVNTNWTTPGTTSRWFQVAMDRYGDTELEMVVGRKQV